LKSLNSRENRLWKTLWSLAALSGQKWVLLPIKIPRGQNKEKTLKTSSEKFQTTYKGKTARIMA
jgi:hypothetical protein